MYDKDVLGLSKLRWLFVCNDLFWHLNLTRQIITVYDLFYGSTCHYDATDISERHRSKAK